MITGKILRTEKKRVGKYSMREQIINTYIPDKKWQYWITQIELKTKNIPTWLEILKSEEGLEWMNTNDNS